jgi:hypothetical protein
MTECPHCGQKIFTWFGVELEPKKVEIIEMIEWATARGGIAGDKLGRIIYPDIDDSKRGNRLRAQICAINNMLAATDWRIVSARSSNRHEFGLYQLIEIKSEAA